MRFSTINRRALSIRARRSSMVIGFAWLFIDFSAAIEGGVAGGSAGCVAAAEPRGRGGSCPARASATAGTKGAPAPAVTARRKLRREAMQFLLESLRILLSLFETACHPTPELFRYAR
jgi:hypothetical protein